MRTPGWASSTSPPSPASISAQPPPPLAPPRAATPLALLLADAWHKGDRAGWERLVRRHLDDIDPADPDISYKYANYLVRLGPDRARSAYRWANVALENRTVWTGATYTTRVSSLYKIRAASAQHMWRSALSAPGGGTAEADRYRDLTRVAAREWLEYAREVGSADEATASELCREAAGNASYCE